MLLNKIFNNKRNLMLFFSVVILILILIIILFVNINQKKDSGISDNNGASVSNAITDDSVLSGDSTFLVVVTGESNDLTLSFLADFKVYSRKLVLTPLKNDTMSEDGRTYGECYAYGGINLLENSVEKIRNIEIDRYAVVSRSGISKITDIMGNVSIYVDEEFTYATSDKTYTVSAGDNEMGSDMLHTYISIISEKNNGEYSAVEVIASIINTYLQSELTASENLFGDITDCFNTNLTISDYYTAKNDIEHLLNGDFTCVLSESIES